MKRFLKFTVIILLCLTLTACVFIGCDAQAKHRPFETQIILHVIDVGQGDAILVISPNNKAMLIDAGEKSACDKVSSVIKSYGADKLSAVVATHPHADHIGGMLKTLKTFKWDKLYMPNANHTSKTYLDLLEYLNSSGQSVGFAFSGMNIPFDDGITVDILAPNGNKYSELNDYSLVLRITYGNISFLLTGDAQKRSEQEILSAFDDIQSDVLKIGHHGSDTSTTDEFLTAVSPSIAVISCGAGNTYGHPSPETLDRLEASGVNVLRTDSDGDVIIYSDGKTIVTETTTK